MQGFAWALCCIGSDNKLKQAPLHAVMVAQEEGGRRAHQAAAEHQHVASNRR